MTVNPNVYGTSENWITASEFENSSLRLTNFKTVSGKTGTGDYYASSIGQGVYVDLINTENAELEDSISPWNISGKSILFNPKIPLGDNEYAEIFEEKRKLFLFYGQNNRPIVGLNEVQKINKIPYNFDAHYSFGCSKSDFLNIKNSGDVFYDGDIYDQLDYRPFVDFNYRDILLVGYVYCTNGSSLSDYFTIDAYYSTEKEIYPYIERIFFKTFLYNKVNNKYEEVNFINFINGGKINCKDITVSNGNFNINQMNGYHVYNVTPYDKTPENNNYFKITYNKDTKTSNQYVYCVNADNRFHSVVVGNDGVENNIYRHRVHYTEFTKEDALKEIAYMGFWFSGTRAASLSDAESNLFGESDNLYLPEFDGTNTTTGEYRYGTDAKNLPNFNYGNMSEVVINTDEEDTGDLISNLNIKALTGGKHYYWLSEAEFEQFIQFLNSSEITTTDFYGKNPAEYISNVTYYPFKLFPSWFPNKLKFRGIDTGIDVEENYLNYGYAYSYQIAITPYFNDFRDYPPYSTAKLFTILGSADIDLEFFMNHVLKVNFYFDISTGSCDAFIFRDELFVEMLSGKYGANISFLAENTGQYQNTMAMYNYSATRDKINYISSMLGGGKQTAYEAFANAAVSSTNYVIDAFENNYQTTHTPPTVSNVGTISSVNNMITQYNPKLVISHCKMLEYDENIYAHNVGHACNLNGVISDFSGYTVCANINCDNISATPEEINMIKSICCSGFYI